MKIKRNRNWLWGILMLFAAAIIVLTQLGLFGQFSFWTMVAAVLAVVFLISSITHKTPTTLPLAAAMVYIVLQNQGILPYVATWALLLAGVLGCAGIGLLLPKKFPQGKVVIGAFCGDDNDDDDGEYEYEYDGEEDESKRREKARAKMGDIDNNPSINVAFGGVMRYLHADSLETVSLSCNFGGMEIFFDQAELSPNGATVYLDCKFGGIDLFVPRHWHVDEQINCTFGGAEVVNRKMASPAEDAPQLTITGNVMFGGVDIKYI